jgi:hypothetical protein
MKTLQRPALWFLLGVMLSVGMRVAVGDATRPVAKPNPNVVVLKSEKRITLERPKLTMTDLAGELSRQAGRSFVLDKPYCDDKTPYAALLARTPLSRVLDATAYLSGGRWERKGSTYRLRTPSRREMVSDATRYGATLVEILDYLSAIDGDDPSLPPEVRRPLRQFRYLMGEALQDNTALSPLPEDVMGDWKITTKPRGLDLSFTAVRVEGNKETGVTKSRSWWW